jgi:branched-chain amino acid transport system ATP-binding protein
VVGVNGGDVATQFEPILECDEVLVRFRTITAVDKVSFALGRDELVALVGPNGAGKTALLNSISGIYQIADGQIRLDGERVDGLRPHRLCERGVGRSFQHGEVFEELTVVENLMAARHRQIGSNVLAMGAYFGPYKRREVAARAAVEELIDFFELERYRHQPVGALAFGVQKLVGVARAVCTDPKVLLLDEPSSGLTRQEKEDFARFLLRLRFDLQLPVLWVEHDMQMVTDLADRIVVLDYGRKIADGVPDEVIRDPQVTAAYLGVDAAALAASPVDR